MTKEQSQTKAETAPAQDAKQAREASLRLAAARIAFIAAYIFLPISFFMAVSAGAWGLLYVLGDAILFWVAFSWQGRQVNPAEHPILSLLLVCEAMLALFYRG